MAHNKKTSSTNLARKDSRATKTHAWPTYLIRYLPAKSQLSRSHGRLVTKHTLWVLRLYTFLSIFSFKDHNSSKNEATEMIQPPTYSWQHCALLWPIRIELSCKMTLHALHCRLLRNLLRKLPYLEYKGHQRSNRRWPWVSFCSVYNFVHVYTLSS